MWFFSGIRRVRRLVNAARECLAAGDDAGAADRLDRALDVIEQKNLFDQVDAGLGRLLGATYEQIDQLGGLSDGRFRSRLGTLHRLGFVESREVLGVEPVPKSDQEDRSTRPPAQDFTDVDRILEALAANEPSLLEEQKIIKDLQKNLRIDASTAEHVAEARAIRLERLHRMRPELDYPAYYLGRRAHLTNKHAEACLLFEKVRGRLESAPRLLNMWAYSMKKGATDENLKKSLDLYRRSLAANPDQPSVHYEVGRIYVTFYRRRLRSA